MSEQVRCVLHNIKKTKFLGRWDTYNVAVTEQRCIFAKLTNDMLKNAVTEASAQGKAEGKGFLARWGDQLQASLSYGNRYLSLAPDDILKENPDNFAVANEDVEAVCFREVRQKRPGQGGRVIQRVYGEVTFKTGKGKTEYALDTVPVDDIAALRKVLGDKVQG